MATVELRFSALPAHVRTARLVAAAVARRSGVDEAVLDEVRLAVGEACSRAVYLHRQHCPDRPVTVTLVEDDGSFRVAVADEDPDPDRGSRLRRADRRRRPGRRDAVPPGVGLAVITGLVDDVSSSRAAAGARRPHVLADRGLSPPCRRPGSARSRAA